MRTQSPAGCLAICAALALGAAALLVPSKQAFATGFAITAQGAGAMARSSAFTAQADDLSAVYYNPAGISQRHGAEILVGATTIRPHTDYQPSAATGSSAEERERYYVLPHLYVTQSLGPHLTAGFGAFAPFGLSTKWPADWDGRFQVVDATIRVSTLNPVLAWRPKQWITVAGGIHYSAVKLVENRALNLAPLPTEGQVSLRGDGRTLGYNGGVLIAPSRRWQVGASYRSRANVEVKDGQADFTVPAPLASTLTSIRTELTLPPSVRTGVLFRPTPDWNVELDAAWTGWSTIDRLEVQFANGLPSDVTTFGWHDSMTYSLGVEYRYSPSLRLRGGYLYDFTPVPDDKANPLIPDADRQGVSVGVGTSSERWTLDVGYQLLVFRRVKENDVGNRFSSVAPPVDARANGLYRSNAHVIGVSVGYRL